MIVDASLFQVLCGDYACTGEPDPAPAGSAPGAPATAEAPAPTAAEATDDAVRPVRAGPSAAPAP